ncbi:MAG: DUF3859 domain-containing protein [Planctomycetota bacterium]
MPKKPKVSIRSFGIYDHWDPESKTLPRVIEFTTTVQAKIDIEFGMVVNITGAKNQLLEYCIDHPGIRDDAGKVRAPFVGEIYVKSNDWDFYLGDTIWNPIDDKLGLWRMTVSFDGIVAAEKSFDVVRELP